MIIIDKLKKNFGEKIAVDSQLEKTEINKADGIEKPGEGAQ